MGTLYPRLLEPVNVFGGRRLYVLLERKRKWLTKLRSWCTSEERALVFSL